jgi:hypothetical protein
MAGDLGVRARWSTVVSGEGGADRVVPRRSKGERVRGETAHRADEMGPRGRDKKGDARATGADTPTPLGRGRDRGRESVRGKKPPLTGGAHLSGGADARVAPLGWTGPIWAEMGFPFFEGISIAFSRVFNSNSNQVSNSNQTCAINSKSNLGSARCNNS